MPRHLLILVVIKIKRSLTLGLVKKNCTLIKDYLIIYKPIKTYYIKVANDIKTINDRNWEYSYNN